MLSRFRMRSASAVVFVAALVLAGTATSATADGHIDPYADIRAFWGKNGVSPETQDLLLAKMEAGELLDANRSTEVPVSTVETESGGFGVTKYTYADGSILVTSLEVPAKAPSGGAQTFAAFGNCKQTSGTGWANYKDCEVLVDTGAYSMGFYVTYEKYSGGYAEIKSTRNPQSGSRGGKITAPTRSFWRPKSSPQQQAVVKYHAEYTASLPIYEQDVYLAFWLTSNGTASVGTS